MYVATTSRVLAGSAAHASFTTRASGIPAVAVGEGETLATADRALSGRAVAHRSASTSCKGDVGSETRASLSTLELEGKEEEEVDMSAKTDRVVNTAELM